MRRFVILWLVTVAAFGMSIPAASADPAVIKTTFPAGFQGTMPIDDPEIAACLGYEGQIFEDRHGVINLTIFTRGANEGAFHVEGTVDATFVISPISGPGTVYTGTYREHLAGKFKTIDGQDIPYPAASFHLKGTGTGDDGSRITIGLSGHFVINKKTGEVRRDTLESTCRVS
jgi:hypothetical protein